MRPLRFATLALAALAGLLMTAEPALSGRCGFCDLGRSYSVLKLGLYSPEAAGAPDGFFGGLEYGISFSPSFDIGVTGDYYYRSRRAGETVFPELDPPYDLPVHGSIDRTSSSVHPAPGKSPARMKPTSTSTRGYR